MLAWPTRPLRETLTARLVSRSARAWWAGRGSWRWRAATALVLLAVGALATLRVRQGLLVDEAQRLEALGENYAAAGLYGKAAGWFNVNAPEYLSNQGYCYYRCGAFEEGVAVLEPRYREGKILTKKGYKALWRCYRELGRYEDSASVVRSAMARFPRLGEECTSVLALLERKMLAGPDHPVPVRLSFAPPDPSPEGGPYYVAGNWTAEGRGSEIHGWNPVPMELAEDGRTWVAEVTVSPTQELPFAAVVSTSPRRFGAPGAGLALFWVPLDRAGPGNTAPLEVVLEPVPEPVGVRPAAPRRAQADGRPRTLAVWPDCGSWFLLNLYAHLGYLPNAARLIEAGTRFEMISTHPPFTSTAYVRMVDLDAGVSRSAERSTWETALIQLKGLPFLDSLIPDSVVAAEGDDRDTIFSQLAARDLSAVNLVFSDKYVSAGGDAELALDAHEDEGRRDVPLDDRRAILTQVLGVDLEREPERVALLENREYFFYGVENTQSKADLGREVWREQRPDFLLLRFPAVDLMSHRYYSGVEKSPASNVLMEVYRHVDRALGELVAELDGDDTLIFVSDHGIYGTLHHHPSCFLILEGPGLPSGEAFGTIPIGHFPCAVLSRFGIESGAERLTERERELFYGSR